MDHVYLHENYSLLLALTLICVGDDVLNEILDIRITFLDISTLAANEDLPWVIMANWFTLLNECRCTNRQCPCCIEPSFLLVVGQKFPWKEQKRKRRMKLTQLPWISRNCHAKSKRWPVVHKRIMKRWPMFQWCRRWYSGCSDHINRIHLNFQVSLLWEAPFNVVLEGCISIIKSWSKINWLYPTK